MSEKGKIRFLVVGAGRIGKRHMQMILSNPDAEVVGVCDIKSPEECGVGDQHPFFNSLDQMLAETDADIMCICTPNHLHAVQAMSGLRAGLHVVVEKPMALNKKDCEDLIALAKVADRRIFTVMQNRYSPPSQWIRSIIDDNLLGAIYMVKVQCFWNRNEAYYSNSDWKGELEKDGGTLFTQFSHFIDIMYWLFGDIKNIQSQFFNFNHKGYTAFEDSGNVQFEFVEGGAGSLSFSTSVHQENYKSSILMIGEKGTVKVGGQYMNEVEFCRIEDYEMPELKESKEANDYGDYKGSASNHHFVIDNAVDVLLGRAEQGSTAEEGLMVVDMIERIYEAGQERPKQRSKALFQTQDKR